MDNTTKKYIYIYMVILVIMLIILNIIIQLKDILLN